MEITVGIPGWPTNFKGKKKERETSWEKVFSKAIMKPSYGG